MNRELSPLEVSNQLKDFVLEFVKNGLDRRFIHGSFDIIEIALKRLEQLEEDFMSLTEANMELVQEQARNQKKLKALEILKTKEIFIWKIKESEDFDDYELNYVFSPKDEISKEEYELLKEVLLCAKN